MTVNNAKSVKIEDQNINMTQKASKSIFWRMSGNIGVSVLRFMGTAVLARILSPEEFGIIGIALLFTGIVRLFGNLGMGQALVQRKKIDQEYLSTAFWTSVLVGSCLSLIGVFSASMAAEFFNELAVWAVIMWLSLNFFFSSLSSIHVVLLTRDLKFDVMAKIEIWTTVIRIAFILTCALLGMGFWSIVIGIIMERIIRTLSIIRLVKWNPSLQFNTEKFKHLFSFGRNIYGQMFVNYFNNSMDYFVTGKFLGTANLAFYQFAFNVPHLVLSHITESVNSVVFPLYSKVQNDKERTSRGYLKTVKFVSMITFPLMVGLFFTADDFIRTAYGQKWLGAVLPMKILCFSGALRSIFEINYALLKSQARADLGFKWNLIMLPVTITAIVIASRWGIVGIAMAMASLSVFSIIIVKIGLRLIKTSLSKYLMTLMPATVNSLIMLVILSLASRTFHIDTLPSWMSLIINILLGALIYFASAKFFLKNDLAEFLNFAGKVFNKQSKGNS